MDSFSITRSPTSPSTAAYAYLFCKFSYAFLAPWTYLFLFISGVRPAITMVLLSPSSGLCLRHRLFEAILPFLPAGAGRHCLSPRTRHACPPASALWERAAPSPYRFLMLFGRHQHHTHLTPFTCRVLPRRFTYFFAPTVAPLSSRAFSRHHHWQLWDSRGRRSTAATAFYPSAGTLHPPALMLKEERTTRLPLPATRVILPPRGTARLLGSTHLRIALYLPADAWCTLRDCTPYNHAHLGASHAAHPPHHHLSAWMPFQKPRPLLAAC